LLIFLSVFVALVFACLVCLVFLSSWMWLVSSEVGKGSVFEIVLPGLK
jgi:hypothetical protein